MLGEEIVIVELSVDELCKNGRPNLDFMTWCMRNGHFFEQDDELTPWYLDINVVRLIISEHEGWNRRVREILDQNNLGWYEVEA